MVSEGCTPASERFRDGVVTRAAIRLWAEM